MKKLIRDKGIGKHGALTTVDATDLVLWKVGIFQNQRNITADTVWKKQHNPEPVEPEDELGNRIKARGDDFESFAKKLGSTKKVLQIFSHLPPEDHLHVIVKLQAGA